MTDVVAGVDYGVRRVSVGVLGGPHPAVMDLDVAGDPKKRVEAIGDPLWVLHDAMIDFLAPHRPTLVAVERPITGRSGNAQTAADMAMVGGVLVLAAREIGAEVVLIAPSSWKKDVCGHGGYDKPKVNAWLKEAHPDLYATCTTQDGVDAYCLALAAQVALDRRRLGLCEQHGSVSVGRSRRKAPDTQA